MKRCFLAFLCRLFDALFGIDMVIHGLKNRGLALCFAWWLLVALLRLVLFGLVLYPRQEKDLIRILRRVPSGNL